MKNIHVLPTEKPSILYAKDDNYKLANSTMAMDWYISSAGYKPYNIYITSDEEIKDGDWMIRGNEQPTLVTPNFFWDFGVRYYKIILTTDQDLIKDGVQAIDDEFLEWFVKNPSCEFVKTKYIKTPDAVFRDRDVPYGYYQIIIPKEEQKQALIDMMKSDEESVLYDQEIKLEDIFNDEKRQGVKDLIDTHKQYFYCSDRLELDENERCVTQCDHCAGKHKQRLEKYSERFDNDKSEIGNPDTWGKRVIDKHKQDDENYLDSFGVTKTQFEVYRNFNKQETLEEAVNNFKKTDVYINEIKQKQEIMYSEEEVIGLLYRKSIYQNHFESDSEIREWFEKFKKK